ncbi:MAG: hypothetical protein R2710_07770 [Acidimicrobiales bacterium]
MDEQHMPKSPSPAAVGFALGRRSVLKSSALLAGAAVLPGVLAAWQRFRH